MLYAHSHPDLPESEWQPLTEHQNGVGELAMQFAAFGTPLTAKLLGRSHDTGKRSDSFQKRLRGKAGKVNHSTAAYLYLLQEWGTGSNAPNGKILAQLLAYPLLGHHGGMADIGSQAEPGTLAYRTSDTEIRSIPDWKSDSIEPLPAVEKFLHELQPFMCPEGRRPDAFATSFLLRMLFSCLVDADFLDTERFCSPERYIRRPAWPSIDTLETRFFQHLRAKDFLKDKEVAKQALCDGSNAPCGSVERREAIRQARLFMLQRCIAAADARPGLFSLTMPTGGGKTLSSLAFALRHARKHRLDRIILAVPYTSIIEQNADVLRHALGEDAVLEHHSNYIFQEESEIGSDEVSSLSYKLSTENWDATIIVTTSVQFFESLFDNRPSRCRKLHNIAKSVIILDEAQMLPIPYIKPCIEALKLLSAKYGSSIVLCTATQPALLRSSFLEYGFSPESVFEIIPQDIFSILFRIFERSTVEIWGAMNDEEIANCIRQESQVLCIVNSRKHAGALFTLLGMAEDSFHLSARMTPEHRSKTLAQIRQRLADGLPCRVVSTSLIECGVDISFPVVMREKNGLDVLAQAAGRCNREGHGTIGRVICFSSDAPLPKKAAELARKRQAFDDVASCEDLFYPETVQAYFNTLYGASRHTLDEKKILAMAEIDPLRNVGPWLFKFASIAREFCFIEEDTASIVIESGQAAEILRQADACGTLSSATVRRLQRFSVQVRSYELDRLKKAGRIEVRHGFLNVLCGGLGYSEKTGLDVTLENGVPVEDLMF